MTAGYNGTRSAGASGASNTCLDDFIQDSVLASTGWRLLVFLVRAKQQLLVVEALAVCVLVWLLFSFRHYSIEHHSHS
jgi:hypothetical protein